MKSLDKSKKIAHFIAVHSERPPVTMTERQIKGKIRHVNETIKGLEKQLKKLQQCLAKLNKR